MDLPLSGSDFKRLVAKSPPVQLENRFAEKNPVLNDSQVTVISRPALKKFAEVGDGPIRRVYSAPGAFNGDLFVVSGPVLYRVDRNDLTSITTIGTIGSSTGLDRVDMAATAPIGEGDDAVPAFLFITDNGNLYVYAENSAATGNLEFTGALSNGEQVVVNTTYYQFTTGSVDSGTPDGSSGNPWLVDMTGTLAESIANLYNAINGTGTAGTDYSTDLTAHTTVRATNYDTDELWVEAIAFGATGNTYSTTETGTNMAWGDTTMGGGGDPALRTVRVPNDAGAISVAHINSYIIVIPVQSDDIKGRFYWVNPGEIVINDLDFSTAERNPDGVYQVRVFGDLFWLLGENTTEPWDVTGDVTNPMTRYEGILFDRGTWEGTAVQVKDSLITVDQHGGVFQIAGGSKRISTPQIEERIRKAISAEAAGLLGLGVYA